MLIALYLILVNKVLPQIGAYATAMLEPLMVIAITCAGIVMILGAVGMNVSNNLGSTIMNGIFRGIGYIFRQLIRAIAWLVRTIVRFLPWVFTWSRQVFVQMGLNQALANVLAAVTTVITLAIII